MSEILENNYDLGKWLESNYWFQDGYLFEYKIEESKQTIYLELAYQTEGTYEANSERTLRVFSVQAEGVSNYTAIDDSDWSKDHCMEGIDIKDGDSISFTLDIPKHIEIECRRVIVQEKPNRVEVVKPWLSETEMFLSVQGECLPTPEEWLQWFGEAGHSLGWRYYSGELKDASTIPQKKYDGWYLQVKDLISETSHGLFFKYISGDSCSFELSLQRNELSDDVWDSLKKIILRYKDIEIRSGNCKFNNSQWASSVVS